MTGSERDAKKSTHPDLNQGHTTFFSSFQKLYEKLYHSHIRQSHSQIVKLNDLGTRLMNYPSPESPLSL